MVWLQARTINQTKEFEQMKHLRRSKLCIGEFFEVNVGTIYIDKTIIKMEITNRYDYNIIIRIMENNNSSEPANRPTPLYQLQTLLKAVFIVMAIFNLQYTLLVGFLVSACGIYRLLKTPQFNKQYLQSVLLRPHGQNILYIGMGLAGNTNFLYYSPLILYFFYGLAEYFKMQYNKSENPQIKNILPYVQKIRSQRDLFMKTKSKLEIIYCIFLLITIPIDFTRILKCLLITQYNMLLYQINWQTKDAASYINNIIYDKIRNISFLAKAYTKVVDLLYGFATRNPNQ